MCVKFMDINIMTVTHCLLQLQPHHHPVKKYNNINIKKWEENLDNLFINVRF